MRSRRYCAGSTTLMVLSMLTFGFVVLIGASMVAAIAMKRTKALEVVARVDLIMTGYKMFFAAECHAANGVIAAPAGKVPELVAKGYLPNNVSFTNPLGDSFDLGMDRSGAVTQLRVTAAMHDVQAATRILTYTPGSMRASRSGSTVTWTATPTVAHEDDPNALVEQRFFLGDLGIGCR